MCSVNEVRQKINEWSPELVENLNSLSYLESDLRVSWISESEWKEDIEKIICSDGGAVAVEIWRKVLKEDVKVSSPVLLLILEHIRCHPEVTGNALAQISFDFSKTLANVSYRAGDSIYEGAKDNFANDEIDLAVVKYRYALSEFRFAIESNLLSDATKRIASGKYATAVAMIGRWVDVFPSAISRALIYSNDSMGLGNLKAETLLYRIELQILNFDLTGDENLLRDALKLIASNDAISDMCGLAEAEVRIRLSVLSDFNSRDARRFIKVAEGKINGFKPRTGVEEARRSVLQTLLEEIKNSQLSIPVRSMAIPRGLLAFMATSPSALLWQSIRKIINDLELQRINRGWAPAAVLSARFLRQMVDGPADLLVSDDLDKYLEITDWLANKSSWNRHAKWETGVASLSVAKRSNNEELASKAIKIFEDLAKNYIAWPLPRIGIARARDYISGITKTGAFSNDEAWSEASRLALSSNSYQRTNLGGRNQVFAVSDVKGFLSETFVFKKTMKDKAEYEANQLSVLREKVSQLKESNRFEIPRSLAIVEVSSEDERRWVHVTQRAMGRLVSELSVEEASVVLAPVVELLGIFHCVGGSAPEGKSAWKSLKGDLKLWSKAIFNKEQTDIFINTLGEIFPQELPLVRKRDGHASNWIVDPAGRIVAIDFESTDFIPLGYDVAQFIEDNGLILANQDGWVKRLEIMNIYLGAVGRTLNTSEIELAYSWFALSRALRLGTAKDAGKQLRRHARELCEMLVNSGSEAIKKPAQDLLMALSRVDSGLTAMTPNHDHRRLSKSMAFILRHGRDDIQVNKAGFTNLDILASALKVEVSEVLAVAEHPAEPRFEVQDGSIRALYGHSRDVEIDVGIKIDKPSLLFHGSSWAALNEIIKKGIQPMERRVVHLTNTAQEAFTVGERKGAPLIFRIEQNSEEKPVAEGIWVSSEISPKRIYIVNPFTDETAVSR